MSRKTLGALAVLLVAGLLLPIGAWSETAPAGKVTYQKGAVEVERNKTWQPMKEGSGVQSGDTIRTGKKARVEIRLADESVIRLGSSTTLVIDKALFKADGGREFSGKMLKGQAYAVASKLVGQGSSFELETGNAVAGVRGTTFRIDSKRDRSTVVRVYTGAVAVSNAPIFAKPGQPTPKEPPPPEAAPTPQPEGPKKPIGVHPGRRDRVEVAGPHEVTKKEWEQFVAQAMQEVKVAANGKVAAPTAFSAEADAADEWVAWNKSRDKEQAQ